MKKLLLLFAIGALLFSCSEDDDNDIVVDIPDPIDNTPTGQASIVINEVAYLNAEVELYNNGDGAMDVSDYFLCLGPGTYDRVGDIIASGNANMQPGDFLVLNYERPGATGGLGLYINNSGFGDAANIADFVQWGDAGSARENVAVDAGIWTAGDFINVVGNENNSIVYDGEGESSSDWNETSTVTLGSANVVTAPEQLVASVVLNEVGYLGNYLELYNNGTATVDVSDYFLCLGPGTYRRIGDLQVEGEVEMEPGSFLNIAYEMPNATGGIGLYANNDGFGDAANILDFVQWGAAGSPRENVAADAGIWTAGEYVMVIGSTENSIAYDGEGSSAGDWSETTTTTFGQPNVFTTPEEPIASVVLNEVGYLGNYLELYNNGTAMVDVSNYFLCLGPGTYRRIGDLEVEGALQMAPGSFLNIAYDMPNATGGIGLYANNDGFGDAANILDFVQWGAAGSPRENVAVDAGIWTAGQYVAVVGSAENSIAYDGEGSSAADWSETTTTTFGSSNEFTAPEIRSIVINEVEYLINDQIELYNNGNVTVDLSTYWMCFGPGQYFRVGDDTATNVVSGELSLEPGEFLVISPVTLSAPDDAGGLGLYANNTDFGNAENIRSFVQWGASGNFRESVAVEAGIWTAGGFVPNVASGSSIAYDGEGFTPQDWSEATTPTLGGGNGSN
ncbi:MAG: hypothetical protein AAF039_10250 [Bacteroidota bacterium]